MLDSLQSYASACSLASHMRRHCTSSLPLKDLLLQRAPSQYPTTSTGCKLGDTINWHVAERQADRGSSYCAFASSLLQSRGFEGSDFAAELSATLGTKVPYSKPLPWRLIAAGVAAMAVAGTLVMLFAGHVSVLASSKALWQLVSLGTMVVMCSGYMWNTIRTPPYVMMGPAGKVEYIAGGFQNQYGAETQIVAAICAYQLHRHLSFELTAAFLNADIA